MIKIVLITGVAGFIGRYAAKHFFENGWQVIGIDTATPENAPLSALYKYYCLNLPDESLHNILKEYQPTALVHCAGRASVGFSISDPAADFYSSTVLTFELLNSLRLYASQCKFILISSAAVYGNPVSLPVSEKSQANPISPYGFHKLQCEQICLEFARSFGICTASVRIFSAYGAGLRRQVLWDICRQAIIKGQLKLQGTGKESRDFIHAVDIVSALSIVLEKAPMEGEAYNLATGREATIQELGELILKSLNLNITMEFDSVIPAGNPLNWRADISKLQSLGFSPVVTLEKGVANYSEWCRTEINSFS
ncbi:MAG: NAD-dependent epimerase/dehydratase family protein [Nitrospirae bacterium]|nr:NAD-dependent epimerase/dehydratase family protein [Nitrospirota bacterium]